MLRHERHVAPDDAEPCAVRAFLLDEGATLDQRGLASPVAATVSDKKRRKVSSKMTKPARDVARPRLINHSRERLRHEIATLRQQEIALAQRLEALQRGETDGQEQSQQLLRLSWWTVAHDQQAQREAAENEREALRTLIRNNKYAIQRVQRFLQKLRIPEMIMMQWSSPAIDSIDASFTEVSNQLDKMCAQTDSVFGQWEVNRLLDEFQDLRIENDMTPNLSVQFRDARMLPFVVETTAEAMWSHHLGRAAAFSRAAQEVVQSKDDSIRRRFDMTLRLRSYKGVLHGVSEARRFVHDDSHIIVYCALGTRANDLVDTASTSHFRYLLLSWTRVRRPEKSSLTATNEPASQVQVVEVSKLTGPRSDDPHDYTEGELHQARDFCTDAMTQLQRLERQAVENLLLDLTVYSARSKSRHEQLDQSATVDPV